MKPRSLMFAPSRNAISQPSMSSTSSRQPFLRPQQSRLLRLPYSRLQSSVSQTIRPLIPPPGEHSGPLMSRRPDRELPKLTNTALRTWLKTLPLFVIGIVVSSLAMFNYQKSTSSTINSILYALRTNPQARALLGDEIYFASKVPWIRGELNPMHGRIDVRFWVKGNKAQGETRFKSERKKKDGYFKTQEWSITMADGQKLHLLDTEDKAADPFRKK
jgi:cytochrome c oxidase assembly factor 1